MHRRSLRLLTLVVALVALAPSPAHPVGLSSDERARLARREIVFVDVLPPGAGPVRATQGGTAMALVNASPEAVWAVLVDYRAHSGLYPRVVSAEVVEADPRHAVVRYTVGVGPFSFAFHVDNYPDAARSRLDWRLDPRRDNDLFHASWGYWQLEPRGDGVLVTYAMAARTVLPAFLTRGANRDGLVATVRAVRNRAEELGAGRAL